MDSKGKIIIPGISDDVAKLTDEEMKLYEKIEFDMEEYAKDVGAQKLLHETKVTVSWLNLTFLCKLVNVSTSATQFFKN